MLNNILTKVYFVYYVLPRFRQVFIQFLFTYFVNSLGVLSHFAFGMQHFMFVVQFGKGKFAKYEQFWSWFPVSGRFTS